MSLNRTTTRPVSKTYLDNRDIDGLKSSDESRSSRILATLALAAERRLLSQEALELRLFTMQSDLHRATSLSDRLRGELQEVRGELARHQPLASRADVELFSAHVLGRVSVLFDEVLSLRALARSTGAEGSNANEVLRLAYLDLLESALTGQIYGDAPISTSWSSGDFDPSVRAIGRDWPSQAHTMIGTARLRNVRTLLQRVLSEHVEGDVLEAGVWRGGASIYMRGILAAHGISDRRVWVADSFQGLPKPSPDAYPVDLGDTHYTFRELAVSRKEVENNFARYGLLDQQVVFLEGWFKDTLPSAKIDRLALLRLDGDMYQSTMETLEALYHKVSPGGYVIVDDYILPGARKAVDDFRGRLGITENLEPIDGAAVFWKVSGRSERSIAFAAPE